LDVVIQSYGHRYGNAPGDPAYDASEAKLAAQPPISVPTIVLHGEADGVGPAAGSEGHARHFTGSYERRVIPVAGHFLPREAPEAVAAATNKAVPVTTSRLMMFAVTDAHPELERSECATA